MGVSVHYRGRLRRPTEIKLLTAEITDLCRSAGWHYQLLEIEAGEPDGLQGILFQPHRKCESVWMTFDRAGILHNVFSIDDDDLRLRDENGWPYVATKTQFAGPETHVVVCKLLRYLGDKYFDPLIVLDEGRYYETGQTKYLIEVMEYLGDVIRDIGESIVTLPEPEGETLEDRILGIARRFRERREPPEE